MTRTAPATRPVQLPDQPHRRQITVGTDGTLWGDAALDWALRHAAMLNAHLRVFASPDTDDQAIARRLNAYRWLHTSVTVSPERPVKILVEASADADLLVLGYRGRHHGPFGLGRSIMPIVTAAHCDTVVIRGEARAVQGKHRWITAALGGHDDDLVVRRAVQFAVRSHSKLRLLHAEPLPGAHTVPPTTDPAHDLEHAHELVRELAPGLTPSLRLVRSQPHEAVRACDRSDLLVIGPGSQTGKLSVITSTALHMATSPVLVVKP
jgi:nucleotide-binding universal stress UspA family protein